MIGTEKSRIEAAFEKPATLPVQVENIPEALKSLAQWVCWGWMKRDGSKWTKPLINPKTGRFAKSTDRETWGTFEQALCYHRSNPERISGIGFVLSPPFVGVDLDDCRDQKTGELESWAAEAVDEFDSYAEASPTGTGIKIFIRGKIPPGGNRKGNVEIYQTGRYFTVTGHRHPDAAAEVEERQQFLELFHANHIGGAAESATGQKSTQAAGGPNGDGHLGDAELIEKAKAAKNGDKFARLWAGDIGDYTSASEATAALLGMLYFWTGGDAAQMDRLFRQSGLLREKWDRPQNGKTWGREEIEKVIARGGETYRPPSGARAAQTGSESPDYFANFREELVECEAGKTEVVKVGKAPQAMGSYLKRLMGGWPKRIGGLLFVQGPDDEPLWLENTDSLFSWVGGQMSRNTHDNRVKWASGADKVTKGEFFQYLQQTAEAFEAIEAFPHEPAMQGCYYMHRQAERGDGKALAELVQRFTPATLIDGDLILAFFYSLIWGGPPGQRPAWLFTADDDDGEAGRGVGKSTLAKVGAALVGGHIDGSPNEPIEKLVTRMLSPEGIGRRVVLIDNIKSLRFSWAELESLITNDTISGHRMYLGEGRRPNTVTFALTLNGASLSRDMAQRCIVVKVKRPEYGAQWEEETRALIEQKRWEIIGDIVEALKQPAGPLRHYARWGAWEAAILARLPEPAECQTVIAERQAAVDDDAAEMDIVREGFIEELRTNGRTEDYMPCFPESGAYWIATKDVGRIVNLAIGEKRFGNKATAYLKTLGVPELRESRRGRGRGWVWRGKEAARESPPAKVTFDATGPRW
jgi:hypothetical protein